MSTTFCLLLLPWRAIGSKVQISIWAVCTLSIGADCAGIGITHPHMDLLFVEMWWR